MKLSVSSLGVQFLPLLFVSYATAFSGRYPANLASHTLFRQTSGRSRKIQPVYSHLQKEVYNNEKKITEKDSLLRFSKDVKHVLHELRGSPVDLTLPKLFRNTNRLSYSNTWALEDWERHYSRKRYFRYILNFPKSRLLFRILPQMSLLTIWTVLVIWVENMFAKKVHIPLAPLGIVSTFVAFLLTTRSNMGLSRLDEGRKAWSKVVLHTKEMAHLISAFIYPHDKQLALKLGREVSCFAWLLKSQLRFVPEEDIADIVNTMIVDKKDARYILQQRQKPLAVVMRIRQAIHHLGKKGKLSTAEEMALDHTAHSLSEVITSTGRIRASPIPVLYTSHTTRLLTFYLASLPTSLYLSGMDGIVTLLITWTVGFAMLGLDELSHLCEQPFRLMPMYQISKRSMLAVADAFTCRPPPLDEDELDDESHSSQKELTTYWNSDDAIKLSDDVME